LGFSSNLASKSIQAFNLRDYKRNKRILKIVVLLISIGGVWITLLRSAEFTLEYSLRMISRYFTIGPCLLEKALNSPSSFGLDNYTYGGVFFAGIIEIIRIIFVPLGVKFEGFFGTAQEYMNHYYEIGNGIRANAFPTMFYYFMRDYGYLGVVLCSFAVGLFFLLVYVHASKKPNFLSYAFFVVVMNIIAYGMCWWPYYGPENVVSCVYVVVFAKLSAINFSIKS
jgi:oligosaccharide repeat unit polymerase